MMNNTLTQCQEAQCGGKWYQSAGFKSFMIGFGVGAAVSCGTTYFVTRKKMKKREEENIRKTRLKAQKRAIQEAQEWIRDNTVTIDTSDPRAISGQIKGIVERHMGISEESYGNSSEEDDPYKKSDDAYGVKSDKNVTVTMSKTVPESADWKMWHGDGIVKIPVPALKSGYLEYPEAIFYNQNGVALNDLAVRMNLQDYEKNVMNLKAVWLALGWGIYAPNGNDKDDDDFMASNLDCMTEEQKEGLKRTEAYVKDKTAKICFITRQDFEGESYFDQVYVDYYDKDNRFIDTLDTNNDIDPILLFGTNNGEDLFVARGQYIKVDENTDPDIVHIRNFETREVVEVTRKHAAYSDVESGRMDFGDSD